ncbi:hypothetical protein NEFER03_2190 [Nematocida sp. LUAm3]|nr:hypothetical protein NEFER03_2190 [Nematocida sp. LUAm3]KAI5176298.1 hypothetical protein NEFER02_2090 [Nematocida sp. LUAm2]KAI5179230.1 hypothetical protein NEFER01_2084 [Nematocida sp. LUAm1]
MDLDIQKNMHHYAEVTENKKHRIEQRRVAREALELKTMPLEEKSQTDKEKNTELRDILVLCTAEKINIPKFFGFLRERGAYKEVNIYFRESIHIMMDMPDGKQGDIFIFKYGVTVFWGIDKETKDALLSQQQFFEEKSYPRELMEREDFRYGMVREGASIVNDVIYLDNESLYNKMIISNALAQSTKLDIFEGFVERTTERVKGLPDEIISKGFTTRKREDIVKMKGLLHRLKFNLNLAANILDTPEILWYYPSYTSLYESFKLYLELKSRTDILNHKCDVIHEILNLLSTHISTKYGERLEKMVILLICIEIVVSFMHLTLSYSRR